MNGRTGSRILPSEWWTESHAPGVHPADGILYLLHAQIRPWSVSTSRATSRSTTNSRKDKFAFYPVVEDSLLALTLHFRHLSVVIMQSPHSFEAIVSRTGEIAHWPTVGWQQNISLYSPCTICYEIVRYTYGMRQSELFPGFLQ